MSSALCPYCRGPVLPQEESVVCNSCGTAHHGDCYAENGGCTVFGCSNAPAEEPKVSVSTPELVAVAAPSAAVPAQASAPAPPPPGAVQPLSNEEQLQRIASRVVPSIFGAYEDVPYTPAVEEPAASPGEPKNRITYMVLGALFGALGAHNFYAGYIKKAALQLGLTVLTLGFGSPMSWIWAVIDICTIDRDNWGVPFRS